MSRSKKVFIAGISLILVLVVLLGCLPNKQGGFTCICAPLLSKLKGKTANPQTVPEQNTTESEQEPIDDADAPQPARTGDITTGRKVEIASQSINPTGGSIVVNKPGDPLDGFVIDVPPNTYTDSRTFKVSSAPIARQTFGDDIDPISPMITVENGGGYADGVMYVRVPVIVPEDSFAMGFIYDEKTGQLTGMPLADVDAESVTLSATHFCSFFISKIKKALLKKDIDSGFRPGIDDWQFRNVGSYIAPKGHCEGQALTALWYYCTQPDGKGLCLYGRYDNNGNEPATPDLWEDDSLGYRFCSVIQKELRFGDNVTITPGKATLDDFWTNLAGRAWDGVAGKWIDVPAVLSDELTFYVFAYTIRATRQPQEVGLWSDAGGGHAMIVYKVVGNALYVADPNYPRNTDRKIIFYSGEGKFKPYQSGANRKEIEKGNTKSYEKIVFQEKSTIVPWTTIAGHWAELKKKTIGNDKFPNYTIKYQDDKGSHYGLNGQWQELKDGYVCPTRKFHLYAEPIDLVVIRDGQRLPIDGDAISLEPGNNLLGILVIEQVGTDDEYVDFKYINVTYGNLAINPPNLEGAPDKEYTFTAKAEGPPAKARYEWTIDGTEQETETNVLKVNTSELDTSKTTPHLVTCKLYDASKPGSKAIAETSASLTVKKEAYIVLHIPSGEAGPDVKYVFTTDYNTVPKGAVFTWFVNGQKGTENVNGNRMTADPGYFKPGTYQIEVVAKWLDGSKKEQSVRDSGIFTVKAKEAKPVENTGSRCPCCGGPVETVNSETKRCKSCGVVITKSFQPVYDCPTINPFGK
jgi:hypothetical protein